MPAPQIDFLIVGQGLAGSILAYELMTRGQRVIVIDNAHRGSSSMVAAGIINPITGHRLNLTDGFTDYFSHAAHFYNKLEREFNISVFKEVDQVRLIKNPGQASYFEKRTQQGDYENFLGINTQPHPFKTAKHGTAQIKQTSIIDTKLLLSEIKTWLEKRNAYITKYFDYARLAFTDTEVNYEGISAAKVVFSEGFQAIHNPWLKHLPFKLAKGEILTVESSTDNAPMLSWGNWLTPHHKRTAKLGSNYAWQDTTLTPSKDVRNKLLDSLEAHTGLRPTVIQHEVGVRPTTTDRQAFVGAIANRNLAYCFNGFGSKGCLTIPTHADLLCNHLLNHTKIPEGLSKWL
jgi:glycine/D-amino acid oxidase-like deaminating enzyme